jgi:hypothetical protein
MKGDFSTAEPPFAMNFRPILPPIKIARDGSCLLSWRHSLSKYLRKEIEPDKNSGAQPLHIQPKE